MPLRRLLWRSWCEWRYHGNTKRGLKGREGVQVSYQGSVSISSIARKMDTMNAQEWCDAFMKGLENENTYYDKNWSLDRTLLVP